MLSDATKSVSRAYINNFVDKDKQTAIDMFLVSLLTSLPRMLDAHNYFRATSAINAR